MRYAIESQSGMTVRAQDATKYRHYRCPVCKGEVFLKGGLIYTHHFAHRKATAKPECELYTPGSAPTNRPLNLLPHPTDGSEAKSKLPTFRSAELCIEIERHQHNIPRKKLRWNLCVTVPRSVDASGQITFDFGPGENRSITMQKLTSGPRNYVIDPNTKSYRAVWCSPEVDQRYREAVAERQTGLADSNVTAFSEASSRFKPRSKSLAWGTRYYFVWPDSFNVEFPPDIEVLPFDKNKNWLCALATLPEEESEALRLWLKKHCLLEVEKSHHTCALLYPFLSAPGYDKTEFLSNNRFLLGFRSTDELIESVHIKTGGKEIDKDLSGLSSGVISASFDTNRLVEIELNGPQPVAFQTRDLKQRQLPEPPVVWFEFESSGTGTTRIPFHTPLARKRFAQVRERSAEIKSATIPRALTGELAWKSDLDSVWEKYLINGDGTTHRRDLDNIQIPRDALHTLQTVLQNTAHEVAINFCNLGEHHFLAEPKSVTESFHLSSDVRTQIIWLHNQNMRLPGTSNVATNIASDLDLVRNFLTTTPAPELVAHYESVRRLLRRFTSVPSK